MDKKRCVEFLHDVGFSETEKNYFHSEVVDVDLRDDDFDEICFVKDSIVLDYAPMNYNEMIKWMVNHKVISKVN